MKQHKHIQTLIEIAKILIGNQIQFIIVGSMARLLKGEKVDPYDIDIFTDIENLNMAHIALASSYKVGEIEDYHEDGKVFKEFHFKANNIPIEVCELNNIDYSKCQVIKVDDIDIYCGG